MKPLCLICCATTVILFCSFQTAEAFDSLDPNGNITVKWDIMSWTADGYMTTVTIFNWQQYRHISGPPGWKLSWSWAKNEVIWTMLGAEAISQGDCSAFATDPLPHSCARTPQIVDLLPTSIPYSEQIANCCKGGMLPSFLQNPVNNSAVFQMKVGLAGTSNKTVQLPQNFTLKSPGPGYTCGPAVKVPPSLFTTDGMRYTEAFMTWNVTCTYSQYLAQKTPSCCVSFSTFYNSSLPPCAQCACACAPNISALTTAPNSFQTNAMTNTITDPQSNAQTCIDPNTPYADLPLVLPTKPVTDQPDVLYCTTDMCPIKIHWHVKANYEEYWRAKVTIINRDFSRNFTDWTLVIQHPNFNNFTEAFSFNYKPLNPFGVYNNDSAVFWGLQYYNEYLMQAGEDGNVQSEMLFRKDSSFTFASGWTFPHRVLFNGDECVLPDPQDYPSLPNSSPRLTVTASTLLSMYIAAIVAYLTIVLFL
ncbi:hypothetical protein BDL97_10G023300 [Sphagnum fallax]|nr:hypothetical protein BDL97_10G023300 [Sphagnum fallax]KAH8949262.1 hypothetical protein BDL97_10G023300 [Sphagnum fallax]